MLTYILRRTLYMIPILIGVTLVTFLLFNVVGGNPAYQFAGKNATAEQIAALSHELGVDRPLHEQYFNYLKQIAAFDFGRSWSSRQTITSMFANGVGASLSLAIPPFIAGTVLSILFALLVAYNRGKWIDKSMMVICLALMSISIVVYILAFQYFFAYRWNWFPISGWDSSWTGRWSYLGLPWVIWTIVSLGQWILLYRTIVLDEVYQDYVRTARAKGLSESLVFMKHVLKNAMIPIITVVVMQMPYLLTGSLLLENFFAIPGLGNMMVQALFNSDFPVVKAMTFIGTLLYMVFNLISDICYSLVDPRVRLE